jgi:hypothetical protein
MTVNNKMFSRELCLVVEVINTRALLYEYMERYCLIYFTGRCDLHLFYTWLLAAVI